MLLDTYEEVKWNILPITSSVGFSRAHVCSSRILWSVRVASSPTDSQKVLSYNIWSEHYLPQFFALWNYNLVSFQVFVWIGKGANFIEKKEALNAAMVRSILFKCIFAGSSKISLSKIYQTPFWDLFFQPLPRAFEHGQQNATKTEYKSFEKS